MPLTDTGIRRVKLKQEPFKPSQGGRLYLWVIPSGGDSRKLIEGLIQR